MAYFSLSLDIISSQSRRLFTFLSMVSVTQSPFVTCCWLFCCRELRVNGRVCYTHRAVRLSKQGVAFAHAGLRRQVGLGDLNGLYL